MCIIFLNNLKCVSSQNYVDKLFFPYKIKNMNYNTSRNGERLPVLRRSHRSASVLFKNKDAFENMPFAYKNLLINLRQKNDTLANQRLNNFRQFSVNFHNINKKSVNSVNIRETTSNTVTDQVLTKQSSSQIATLEINSSVTATTEILDSTTNCQTVTKAASTNATTLGPKKCEDTNKAFVLFPEGDACSTSTSTECTTIDVCPKFPSPTCRLKTTRKRKINTKQTTPKYRKTTIKKQKTTVKQLKTIAQHENERLKFHFTLPFRRTTAEDLFVISLDEMTTMRTICLTEKPYLGKLLNKTIYPTVIELLNGGDANNHAFSCNSTESPCSSTFEGQFRCPKCQNPINFWFVIQPNKVNEIKKLLLPMLYENDKPFNNFDHY
ncbi:uncharacterized protein isoform X2 [Rhodnius prolixus]